MSAVLRKSGAIHGARPCFDDLSVLTDDISESTLLVLLQGTLQAQFCWHVSMLRLTQVSEELTLARV